jgi:hypothetical protein
MKQRVSLITLGTRDLGRARRFYEALGWETGGGPEDDVVWDRARLAEDGGVRLG